MKKFFIIALAALGLVACNNNLDDVTNGGLTGEAQTSYIAINLNAADNTRAAGDEYQDGLEAERLVKAAYFFFFDNAGNAFPVTGNPATAPGTTGVNWISANLNNIGSETPNVSDIKDAVLVLSTYEGEFPSQIVAVINWVPTTGTAYNLDDLYAATNIQGADNGFVMSNAVYADANNEIVGTPLTTANIHKSPADALANPITIHVERIAAKVTVTVKDTVTNNRFPITKKNGGDSSLVTLPFGNDNAETEIYVLVEGWELYNDFTQSKLLKDIDPDWTELGFTWNDPDYYRCYWAKSLGINSIVGNTFPTTFSLGLGKTSNVNNGTYADNTYTYVGENTLYDATAKSTANCTKVIIKAKLQKKTGDNTYADLHLARWYTTYYAGLTDLLTAVASTIKYQYVWLNGSTYEYITPDDLTVKQVAGDNKVIFQLSASAESKNWHVPVDGSKYEAVGGKDNMNAILATIEKAIYYDKAETLFSVDIAHLGNGKGAKAGDYGVVRNHIYNVIINSFGGFGSPVYVPGNGNLEYPDDPTTDAKDYVSAQVRVLSWRLVNQEVDVQP